MAKKEVLMSLVNRYDDAYLLSKTINSAGQSIKLVGFVIAGVFVLVGFLAAKTVVGITGTLVAFLFGAAGGILLYGLGVLICAQGQILMAALDTAVNSSPILSKDEIRAILTGSAFGSSGASYVVAGQGDARSGGVPVAAYRLCSACGSRNAPDAPNCHCGKDLTSDPLFTASGQRFP
jgi:hypothetical protein